MKWISVEERMPEKDKSVEYKATVMNDTIIQGVGKFVGCYVDSEGEEWEGMHIFVNDDHGGFLTGDVEFWREVKDDQRQRTTRS